MRIRFSDDYLLRVFKLFISLMWVLFLLIIVFFLTYLTDGWFVIIGGGWLLIGGLNYLIYTILFGD